MARTTVRCNTSALDAQIRLARWSNSDLARAAGVSKGTIGHLRSGSRDTTTSVTATAIEKALRVDPGAIFRVEHRSSAA